jgi:hypothetical protein
VDNIRRKLHRSASLDRHDRTSFVEAQWSL